MSARRGETRRQFAGARLRYAALFAALRSRSPTPRQRGHARACRQAVQFSRTGREMTLELVHPWALALLLLVPIYVAWMRRTRPAAIPLPGAAALAYPRRR